MAGKEIYHKVKDKVKDAFSSSGPETGKGKTKLSGKRVKHGYQVGEHDLGLFAIFDGHLGHTVPDFLRSHLFDNILSEPEFLSNPKNAIRKAYQLTDEKILENASELGRGGSTAVTAILIGSDKSVKLVVANVGDSRAVISKNGVAEQLSVDHEPTMERPMIEKKGGFVSNLPGDVPRVDGQLAVARAFGDRSLKKHLSSEPYVVDETITENSDFLILASDGLWKVMSNQEAVDEIKDFKDAQAAAKHLTEQAVNRKSKDDISVIVVKFLC
jgi:protein phosphatase 1L